MTNVKCTNEACSENQIVKDASAVDTDAVVTCGECWEPCERTDEEI